MHSHRKSHKLCKPIKQRGVAIQCCSCGCEACLLVTALFAAKADIPSVEIAKHIACPLGLRTHTERQEHQSAVQYLLGCSSSSLCRVPGQPSVASDLQDFLLSNKLCSSDVTLVVVLEHCTVSWGCNQVGTALLIDALAFCMCT